MRTINSIYIIMLAALVSLTSCSSDDTEVFPIKPTGGVEFTPKPGGAIMTYTLPNNSEINRIRARYIDENGKEVNVLGSYLSTSLELAGFNEAKTSVPIHIAYLDKNGVASEEYETTFSTGDSGAFAFFKTAEVKPAWNGFELTYDLPEEGMNGLAHVFYVGINPHTGEQDTLLVNTITLTKGSNDLFFTIKQQSDENTIVVKTEDYRGYFVKQQEWKGIKSYSTTMLEQEKIKFTCSKSCEMEDNRIGLKYLSDGDTKGIQALNTSSKTEYYTCVMGPDACGESILLDLGSQYVPATVRIYAQMKTKSNYKLDPIWYFNYSETLPCEVTVYGSNDNSSWTKIGYVSQPEDGTGDRWYAKDNLLSGFSPITEEKMLTSDPVTFDVSFPVSDITYRYLKVVPEKTFNMAYNDNSKNKNQYVTMQELEVYIKK